MPTVVDELVVVLGLDPKQFTKGQQEALEAFRKSKDEAARLAQDMEKSGQRVDDILGRIKRGALGMAAAFIGGRGLKEFFTYITQVDAATGRLSYTMGESTKTISAWQGVFETSGGKAESASAAMQALTRDLRLFSITGQSQALPIFQNLGISIYDNNHKIKTASQLYLELAKAVEGLSGPDAAARLSLVPGMNEDAINVLIQGEKALRNQLKTQEDIGTIMDKDAAAAQRLTRAWKESEQQATALGRTIVTSLSAPLSTLLLVLSNGMAYLKRLLKGENITPRDFRGYTAEDMLGSLYETPQNAAPAPKDSAAPAAKPNIISRINSTLERSAVEGYIRQAATKRGIDPNIAVAVAKSEGLANYYGDKDATGAYTSYGPFQLHYAGVGRNTAHGLGEEFTKKTGLHAKDQSTVQAQVDFALDNAKEHGWGAWHGWKGLPYAGISSITPSVSAATTHDNRSTSIDHSRQTHVGKVEIHTNERTADGIFKDVQASIDRVGEAASANYAQQ